MLGDGRRRADRQKAPDARDAVAPAFRDFPLIFFDRDVLDAVGDRGVEGRVRRRDGRADDLREQAHATRSRSRSSIDRASQIRLSSGPWPARAPTGGRDPVIRQEDSMRRAWLACFCSLAACVRARLRPAAAARTSCSPGDLVITEVFADYGRRRAAAAPTRARSGSRSTTRRIAPIVAQGPDDRRTAAPTARRRSRTRWTDVTIAPGQFFTLGNATPDLRAAVHRLRLRRRPRRLLQHRRRQARRSSAATTRSTARSTTRSKAGHSRQLTNAQPPDYTLNDDRDQLVRGDDTEFEAGNFGTPGGTTTARRSSSASAATAATMRDDRPARCRRSRDHRGDAEPGARAATPSASGSRSRRSNDVDLNGVGLDRAGDTRARRRDHAPTACLRLTRGQLRACSRRSPTRRMNGGLPHGSVLGTFTFSLVAGTAAAPGDVQIVTARP